MFFLNAKLVAHNLVTEDNLFSRLVKIHISQALLIILQLGILCIVQNNCNKNQMDVSRVLTQQLILVSNVV
jgi:putative flippase GtrA